MFFNYWLNIMHSEERRQAVHILLFLLAFLLKYLTNFQAAGLLLLLLFTVVVLVPKFKIKKYFYRRFEDQYSNGAVLYFFILFVLVLLFDLHIVAASWAILALGDGSATLIGKNLKVRELPWNKEKSYVGTISFVVFGTLGAWVMLNWMNVGGLGLLEISFKAALIAGIAESLHMKINDNITVAVASAIALSVLL